jgi:hypothetical protein
MEETQKNEQNRILEMVASGKVTPTEGERLLALLDQRSGRRRVCPFCAETIPAETSICPECGSVLTTATAAPVKAQNGFHALPGLGRFLVIYTFFVCGAVLLINLFSFGFLHSLSTVLLAGLGLTGAILICKESRMGWILCTLWAGIQIVPIILNGTLLNQQLLHLGVFSTSNGSGIGFNLVGLILLILFIKSTPKAIPLHLRR